MRLAEFLERSLSLTGPMEVEQFPRGFSNLTYLLRVGGRELVLRRPPFGVPKGVAHDMLREHRILSRLHPLLPVVPQPLASCDDDSVIGAPFYVMERVSGVILRERPPEGVTLDAATMTRLCNSLVDTLVSLHAVDVDAAQLGELGRRGGYVERQVGGWSKRWAASRTDDVPAMERAIELLQASRPDDAAFTVVHNDFKFDNLVLEPRDLTVRAVLDWEMAAAGDPLMDLGTTLGYWVERGDSESLRLLGLGVTQLPGSLTREQVVERYARATGRDLSRWRYYHGFGLFKIAVIAQQIFARYRAGLTADPRFARLGDAVRALGSAAEQALQ
ncbi:MAG: hypothetical protein JWO05_2467 [Gemmatimonadetes bacterium]|nr:hypothetical protein [Gemmatimonadota bacterium]